MGMIPARCTQCGADLEVDASADAAICPNCSTPFIVEKAINNYNTTYKVENLKADKVIVQDANSCDNLILAGEDFLKLNEKEKARDKFQKAVSDFPGDYRGWLGLIKVNTDNFTNKSVSYYELSFIKDCYSKIDKLTIDTDIGSVKELIALYVSDTEEILNMQRHNAQQQIDSLTHDFKQIQFDKQDQIKKLKNIIDTRFSIRLLFNLMVLAAAVIIEVVFFITETVDLTDMILFSLLMCLYVFFVCITVGNLLYLFQHLFKKKMNKKRSIILNELNSEYNYFMQKKAPFEEVIARTSPKENKS